MIAWLRELLHGDPDEDMERRSAETRSKSASNGAGVAFESARGLGAPEGAELGDGDDSGALERFVDQVGAEVERRLEDRLTKLERDVRVMREEWDDTLARIAKISGRLAAQARRDLERATDALAEHGTQLALPNVAQPPGRPLSRAELKAQYRRKLAGPRPPAAEESGG